MSNREIRVSRKAASAVCVVGLLVAPAVAHAYIGPGAGFALVSSFLTLAIAFLTAFFALLTFPFRAIVRTIRRRRSLRRAKVKKVIVLGLDGLEPTICERMIERGELPNFKKLMEAGSYRRLGTSSPALSPVAWSTFATGADSSRHAIYDFLSRDRRSYLPKLSSSEVYPGGRFVKLGPFRFQWGRRGGVRMLRKSKSFWKILGEHGVFTSVLRVPITFPVEKVNGVMVAGMCVPDLRGTMGSFTYFTTAPETDRIGGLVVRVPRSNGWIGTEIPGPSSPVNGRTLTVPLSFRVSTEPRGMEIRVGGEKLFVPQSAYSPWVRLSFKAALGLKLHGIVRFYPTRTDPDGDVGLYMTPIHIDPEKPAMPITHPPFFSIYLAKLLGPFGTLGLAEDTWAMNERVLDEKAFLEQAYLFHDERIKMWFHSLDRLRDGMVACVFDLSDRLQHMFFRYLDPEHPANRGKDTTEYKDAVYEMYRKMDDLLGRTMKYVDGNSALIVLSDHGFKQFRRGVNLNTWLRDQGLLALREGAGPGEYLSSVDWSRTKAYAIGLDGIYINKKGRERQGIVDAAETAALKRTIIEGLTALSDDGNRPIRRVIDVEAAFTGPYRCEGPDLIPGFAEGYRMSWDGAKGTITDEVMDDNTRSWSGDHCMDPEIVPGILYTNLKVSADAPRLMDIGPTVLDLFGVDVPPYMGGKSIL